MKKFLMATALCLVCAMSFGQRTYSSENFITETVDEFGDKTGNIKVGIIAKGYFSNSATTNSCAQLVISIMKNDSWYSLYEYCGDHISDDQFKVKFIGTATKEEVIVGRRIPYDFIELCKNNDTINVKMIETGSYATTTAVFKLYKCNEFYDSYVKTFGLPKYVTYEYIEEHFLKVYQKEVIENERTTDVPSVVCNVAYNYNGRYNESAIKLEGRFKNSKSFSIYGKNITLDGKSAKLLNKYSTRIDVEWFLNNVHAGSVVRVTCDDDSTMYEEITISEEQYNAIINLYNK